MLIYFPQNTYSCMFSKPFFGVYINYYCRPRYKQEKFSLLNTETSLKSKEKTKIQAIQLMKNLFLPQRKTTMKQKKIIKQHSSLD